MVWSRKLAAIILGLLLVCGSVGSAQANPELVIRSDTQVSPLTPGPEWDTPERWGIQVPVGATFHAERNYNPDKHIWVLLAVIDGPAAQDHQVVRIGIGTMHVLGDPLPPGLAGRSEIVTTGESGPGWMDVIDWIIKLPQEVSDAISTLRDPVTLDNYSWAWDRYLLWNERIREKLDRRIVLTISRREYLVVTDLRTEVPGRYFVTPDVAPQIIDDRTYTPARVVAEELGANIWYYQFATGYAVRIRRNSTEIKLTVDDGKASATRDGQPVDLVGSPQLVPTVNGTCCRLLLPARFVAENLGATVRWDPILQEVWITYFAPDEVRL